MNAAEFYPIFLKAKKVIIDSRLVESGDIFIAFSGQNYNAATLAEEVIKKGAAAVIVEDKEYENPEKNIFYADSSLRFLQDLAKEHRKHLKIPIISLTGSNGKTTTKELINSTLSAKFKVQATVGNLNNHIGVPLTVLSIKPEHEIAVVEMGANHQGEIAELCEIAKPDIGYITNFGKAHLEGFGGEEGVIKGKSELYQFLEKNGGTVLVNQNDVVQVEKSEKIQKKITFGTETSDFYFQKFSKGHFAGIVYENRQIISKLTGDYNFNNICAAISLGLHFGIDFSAIKNALESYTPSNMRSQVTEKNGKILVLDTYNANPSSMAAALENFKNFEGIKTVIMGDMLELGEQSAEEHQLILQKAKDLSFEEIITVGPRFAACNTGKAFASVEEAGNYLKINPAVGKNILLKGSRGIALEKLIDFL